MHDQAQAVHDATSSVSAAAMAKSVVGGSTVIGAGEFAKQSAGGWMLTYFFPVIDVNTIQLMQLAGGIYMVLQVLRFLRDEYERYFVAGKQDKQSQAMSINGGQDKPKPR